MSGVVLLGQHGLLQGALNLLTGLPQPLIWTAAQLDLPSKTSLYCPKVWVAPAAPLRSEEVASTAWPSSLTARLTAPTRLRSMAAEVGISVKMRKLRTR